jgi:hypothetical protein
MKVEIEIGQMHRFELREALLIYREGRRSFITRHDVLAQKQGPPVLGVAQPLTTTFVENLAESLGGSTSAEVLSREHPGKIRSNGRLVDSAAPTADVL